jgi:hypothetical protein
VIFVRSGLGLVAMVAALVPVWRGSRDLRRSYLPELEGPSALLTEIVVIIAIIVITSEILGTVGLFKLLPVLFGFAGAGLAASTLARRRSGSADSQYHSYADGQTATSSRLVGSVAALSVAAVTAEWMTRTLDSLRYGMSAPDTLWYHMPVAARFAQTGHTLPLQFVDGGSLTAFYPSTTELLHALGILVMGNDTLSPIMNLGWLALALFAGWCIGRPFGLAPVTLMGVALVLATPEFVFLNAGEALNDVAGVSLLLAGIAILITGSSLRGGELSVSVVAYAALATGLAFGIKYTFIPVAAFLGIGVVAIAPRSERLTKTAIWLMGVCTAGGYWYLRNVVHTGNPIPSARIGLGPVHLPVVPVTGTDTVGRHLFDGNAWAMYFLPGVRAGFGNSWWILLVAVLAGLLLGTVVGPGRVGRMVALVGVFSLVAYLLEPQALSLGFNGAFVFFKVDLRYAAPALIIGVVALPLATLPYGRWARNLVTVSYAVAIGVTQLNPGLWNRAAIDLFTNPTRYESSLIGAAAIGLALAIAMLVRIWYFGSSRSSSRSLRRFAPYAALLSLSLAAAGFAMESYYLGHRYRSTDQRVRGGTRLTEPVGGYPRRMQAGTRVAIVGLNNSYLLYGANSSNDVQYAAVRHADGTSAPISNCTTWRRWIDEGHYRYVVVATPGYPLRTNQATPQVEWSESAATQLVEHNVNQNGAQVWLFRLDSSLDPSRCP